MAKIVLLTGNHLCHNPRVLKEATVLSASGFDVQVLGAWSNPALRARDETLLRTVPFTFTPVIDLNDRAVPSHLGNLGRRARTRVGNLVYRWTGKANVWQLGHVLGPLRRAAIAAAGDLLVAHSEAGMQVAAEMGRAGMRVGVDMEDWFSEDLSLSARRNRPVKILRELEEYLLRTGRYTSCPSQAMAEALSKAYGCPPPTVVYNSFPWADRLSIDRARHDRGASRVPSLHWYSQSLGPGRGLEDLFAALPLIESDMEVHLRGQPISGALDWIERTVPRAWKAKLFLHPLVANDELLSRIAEHDIGFAGEVPYILNKDLTVSNKVLHYLLGGLAVIASGTTGQREVARKALAGSGAAMADDAGPVLAYPPGNASALASCINRLLGNPERLRQAKAGALRAARSTFSWENQAQALVDAVSAALRP